MQARKFRCIGRGVACSLLLFFASTYAVAVENDAATQTYVFDIPEQSVISALIAFAEQADLTLVFPDQLVDGKSSNAVRGEYSREQAINILLADTGLAPRFSSDGTLTIAVAVSPPEQGVGDMNNKETNSVAGRRLAAVVAGVTVGAGVANAQSDATYTADDDDSQELVVTLDEIIVTANRREESILDVSSSLTAFGQDFIEQRSIDDINDLVTLTPGVTSRNTELFGQNTTFTIRGVGGSTIANATTGVYLDDVPLTFGAGANEPFVRTFDLQRVEILRGPQGTLYGAGAMGGAVRYISNRPNLEDFEGQVRLDYGDTDLGDTSSAIDGVLNVPIVEGRAALRLSGSLVDTGGYIDYPNSADGNVTDGNDTELSSIRADLGVSVTDKLSVNLQFWHQTTDFNGLSVVSASSSSLYNNDAFTNIVGGSESTFDQAAAVIRYDFGWAELVSSTSVFEISTDAEFAVFTPVAFENTTEGLTQETRLVSADGGGRWDWVAGIFYQDGEANRRFQVTNFGLDSVGSEERQQLSVYGELTYNFSEDLAATVGLRHFTEDVDITERRSFGGMAQPEQTADSDSTKTVPKLALAYTGIDHVMLYGSVSQGFRVGGANLIRIPGTNAPDSFDSDQLWAYEIGAKFSRLGGKLSGSVALYHIDWEDLQLFTGDFGFPIVINGGSATITGIETELSYQFSDRMVVGFNGSLMEAESAEDDPRVGTVDGQRLNRTPEGSAALFVNYSRPLTLFDSPWTLGLAADAQFTAGQITNQPTFPLFREEFHTVNTRVTLVSDSWEFAVYARNLNNDDTPAFFGPTDLNVPRPRTVGIEIVARY